MASEVDIANDLIASCMREHFHPGLLLTYLVSPNGLSDQHNLGVASEKVWNGIEYNGNRIDAHLTQGYRPRLAGISGLDYEPNLVELTVRISPLDELSNPINVSILGTPKHNPQTPTAMIGKYFLDIKPKREGIPHEIQLKVVDTLIYLKGIIDGSSHIE